MIAIYGTLEHPIVHKWAISLHGLWLAAGKWVKVFHYINQVQFSIVRKTALSYDLLYFCLPAGHFTEVYLIVILHLLPHYFARVEVFEEIWVPLNLAGCVEVVWTVGFDRWVTNASTMSRSLSGSVVKKLGWVLIMVFCTALSAQLYRWILNWELGIFVILVKTSQSIQNFLNCCGVIPYWDWGGLAASAWMQVDWAVASLSCLRMHRASPISVTPSSFSIEWSSIWRLSIVSFLSANFVAWLLEEPVDIPASIKKYSQTSGVIDPVRSTM